jgi:photosystem II stability/assembly factor-like uncharacterized protein
MKKTLALVLLIVIAICFSGCAPAPTEAPATAIPPTDSPLPPPTITPTPAPDYGPWHLVRQIKYSDPSASVYYGGFLNDSFGILIGASGLVEYTQDGGQSWGTGSNQSWCRFGLDIVDEKIAWNCGNPGHVRLTTDGGKTWTAVADYGPGEPNHCRYLSFLDAQTGWAATPGMLAATSDGAATWTDLALPAGTGEIAAISLRTPTDGYVLDARGTLLATADGGTTWESNSVNLPAAGELLIDPTPLTSMRFWDADHGRILVLKSGFWTGDTSDGGKTWTWTKMPSVKGARSSYMSRDGRTLSMIDVTKQDILLLEYAGA